MTVLLLTPILTMTKYVIVMPKQLSTPFRSNSRQLVNRSRIWVVDTRTQRIKRPIANRMNVVLKTLTVEIVLTRHVITLNMTDEARIKSDPFIL